MDRLRDDVRFSFRALVKNPLITAAAIASLALGVGANAAIFSAVDTFMFRPLEFEEADNIVRVWTSNDERGWREASSSVPDFLDWRRESRSLLIAAHSSTGVVLTGGAEPERISANTVSIDFFDVLRKGPVHGRGFRAEEEQAGGPRVVILGDGLWQRRFGGATDIIGQVIRIDGEPTEVIGIMPRDVGYGRDPDIWLPMRISGEEPRASRFLNVLARIQPGFTLSDARAELNAIQSRLSSTYPENAGNGANVLRLQEDWFDEGFRQGSLIGGTAVLFVLLIACANVANLLLSRAAGRSREIALRTAIGAGRGRIFRQLFTESLMLAIGGGIAAVPLAFVGIRGIQGLFPPDLPGVGGVAMSGRVLLFMAAVSLLSALFFGLLPAFRLSRANLRDLITDGGRGSTGTRGGRVRAALVVAEMSLSLVLLVASVLLVKAFVGLRTADVGYDIDDRVTMDVTLPGHRYADVQTMDAFQRRLLERITSLPGARAAALSSTLPMRGGQGRYYVVPDEPPPEPGREPVVNIRYVSPGFFETMGIERISGRVLNLSDSRDAPPVVIVNQLMAARHWPDVNPVGRRIQFAGVDHEIVGVVEDTRDWGPDDSFSRMVYLPILQSESRDFSIVVHTPEAPAAVATAVRATVRELDPEQPVHAIDTMRRILEEEVSGSGAMAKVLGALAVIALVLAAVGVYGVMAYSVSQRTQEVGIRMALGAQRADVLRLVLRQGGLVTGLGIAIGLAIALGVTRLLSFFLYGVSPFDLMAFTVVPLSLALIGLIATALPAHRAAGVDPVIALRTD